MDVREIRAVKGTPMVSRRHYEIIRASSIVYLVLSIALAACGNVEAPREQSPLGPLPDAGTDAASAPRRDAGAGAVDGSGQDGRFEGDGDEPSGEPHDTKLGRGIGVGVNHACAVRRGGVYCWGSNGSGQLGDGTRAHSDTPVRVIAVEAAVEVDAGRYFSCARRRGGEVLCWGGAAWLGSGATSPSLSPVAVRGLTDAVELDVGPEHACARKIQGAVTCWGNNQHGQAGPEKARQAPPHLLPDLEAVEVAVGSNHSCARTAEGEIFCWGDNHFSQLGNLQASNSSNTPPTESPWRVSVPGIDDAVGITAYGNHSCALRAGGRVICWGGSPAGPRPLEVQNLREVVEVRAGGRFDCARLRSGEVRCWYFDPDSEPASPRARPVVGIDDAVEIDVGTSAGCARRTNGEVLCWGNDRAPLGIDAPAYLDTPIEVPGLSKASQLSSGGTHSCAVGQKGRVVCWGGCVSHGPGALRCIGDETDGDRDSDAPLPRKVRGLDGAVAVASGFAHICALQRGGKVLCWGDNAQGQLGGEPRGYEARPRPVPGLPRVVEIAANGDHTCARRFG